MHKRPGRLRPIGLTSQSRSHCTRCGHHVGHGQLIDRQLRVGIAIRVIDKSVKRLIDPLPEHDGWHSPIKRQHSSGDQHTARQLEAHTADEILHLAGVRMEGGREQFLGVDDLLAGGSFGLLANALCIIF